MHEMTGSSSTTDSGEILNPTGRTGLSSARHFRNVGAEFAVTFFNETARPHVQPLAKQVGAPIFEPCGVSTAGQLESVFEVIRQRWGRLDFLLHSIAWAREEDLHGRLTGCSAEGFAESMLVSCHSLFRLSELRR